MITLENNFHNTKYNTRLSSEDLDRRIDVCNNPDYRGKDKEIVEKWAKKV